MSDKMNPEQRHYCMSKVRSADTKPEMIVRRFLHSKGFRYSLHRNSLPGCPDIVLRKYHCVIFVNGCFWHGHPGCRYAVIPQTNSEFWKEKFTRNKERDAHNIALLENLGWITITVWECELKKNTREATLNNLATKLQLLIEPDRICHITGRIRRISLSEQEDLD